MQEKIRQLLKDFVAIPSISCSREEIKAAEFVRDYFAKLPYYAEHPEHFGLYDIPDDPYDRKVPYAFLKGNSDNTVVLMGHFDVVSVEDYGEAIPLAFSMGKELEDALSKKIMPPEARKDMESGEFEWGRGVMDMKAGVVVFMALMEDYAKQAQAGTLPGNIVFLGVPDEESYSAGMRAGVTVLSEFKDRYGLRLNLMIDGEPCPETKDGEMILTIGSIGKILPVVMVQGVTAHSGNRFNGITPLSILTRMEQKTDESLIFTNSYKGDASMPPSWLNLRDMKRGYDVSIPFRAYGYLTVLSFTDTPDQIMAELKRIANESFEEAVDALDRMYQQFKKANVYQLKDKMYYEPLVLSIDELVEKLKGEKGAEFDAFYERARSKAESKVLSGELNYPDATVTLMEDLLNYADIKQPLVLIGFAPPYYPAINSDLMPGHEGCGEKLFEEIAGFMKDQFGRGLAMQYYSPGVSDMSYSGLDHEFDTGAYSKNTPIWGKTYSIDFKSLANLNMPCIILGPIGKDAHQWTERLLKKSVYEEAPAVNKFIIDKYMAESL